MGVLRTKILRRVHGTGRGSVFVSKDFLDLGSRAAVDQALSRLVKDGSLRRLGRGLFDYPRVSPKLGVLSPDADQVANAVARKRGGQVQRSGAFAANALGLSTQVPGKPVYVTTSASGKVRAGNQTLTFKRVSPKRMAAQDTATGSVLQALDFMGKDGITDAVVKRLRSKLSAADKKRLLKESRYAAGWVADAVRKVVMD
jgi:hypothetical protein